MCACQSILKVAHGIGDLDFSKEEVEAVLDLAIELKKQRKAGEPHPILCDKVLAMLFFFTSTRTRGSFEAGMAQLGGKKFSKKTLKETKEFFEWLKKDRLQNRHLSRRK